MMSTELPHRVWLHGASGRMGQEIQKLFSEGKAGGLRLIGGSSRRFEGDYPFYQGREVTPELLSHALSKDEIDVILDFSSPAGGKTLALALAQAPGEGRSLLLGTTGMSQEDLAGWRQLAGQKKLRLLVAPNTSIGILLTAKAALLAAKPLRSLGFDIEITETHHRAKLDAPSGTANFLANTLVDGIGDLHVVTDRHGARQPGELGVHSVRGGGVFGEHEIRLIGDSEEVRISHRAFNRTLFAAGSLVLATWLVRQDPGVYGLLDIDPADLSKI